MKNCEACGAPLVRKQYETRTESPSAYQTRKFCNAACWGKKRSQRPLSKTMVRKRSQALYPDIPPCQECGSTYRVQRHHPTYERYDIVKFLCPPCHAKADQQDGTRRVKPAKPCPICGTMFTHYTHSRNQTCSKECLSEIGRRNAMKRWGKRGELDLNDETPGPGTGKPDAPA